MRIMKKTTKSTKPFFLNGYLSKPFFIVAVILLHALFAPVAVFAQNKIVKGRVLNEEGEAVPRATVSIKGTSNGTATDNSGNFQLSDPANGTIIISAVNFVTLERKLPATDTGFDVKLVSSNKNLSEVVVVGYGTQKRKDVTGSIVSVTESYAI